jgi:hypothetical protein
MTEPAIEDTNYHYCECSNEACGARYIVAIPGTRCPQCEVGMMQAQDVEPW